MNAGIINYAVYEDGNEYRGTANVKLPDRTKKKFTVNGAGIAGDVDIPANGHYDAMTVDIVFLDAPKDAYKLCESRRHLVTVMAAHEDYDETLGKNVIRAYKHVMELLPTAFIGGTAAPTAAQAASGTYSCLSIKDYIDGELVNEVDPLRWRDIGPDGVDSLAEVRAALGK